MELGPLVCREGCIFLSNYPDSPHSLHPRKHHHHLKYSSTRKHHRELDRMAKIRTQVSKEIFKMASVTTYWNTERLRRKGKMVCSGSNAAFKLHLHWIILLVIDH